MRHGVSLDCISGDLQMIREADTSFQGTTCVNFSELAGTEIQKQHKNCIEDEFGESGEAFRATEATNHGVAKCKRQSYEQVCRLEHHCHC